MFIKINGLDQWVSIHGDNRSNPVLMVVNGAGLALSRMAAFFEPWESAFRLLHWDQPGAGATWECGWRMADGGLGGLETITFDRLAADGVAVADAMRTQLGVPRIVLLATSGGSIVGLKMIKLRPDLFSAYVGTGQIVRGADVTESKEGLVLTPAEQAALAAMPRTGGDQRPQVTTLYEQMRGAMAAFDARALGLDYAVPMYFIQGDCDRYTPTERVAAFERAIIAPAKRLVIVEGGGHAVVFMREQFLAALKGCAPVLATGFGEM